MPGKSGGKHNGGGAAIKEGLTQEVDFELDLEGELECGHAEMGRSVPCVHVEALQPPSGSSRPEVMATAAIPGSTT